MDFRTLKNSLAKIRHTAFHPQWFVYAGEKQKYMNVNKLVSGRVLDIGCADGSIKQHLSKITSYIGLDYYSTAENWYKTRPDIYGDAHTLLLLPRVSTV